MDNRSGDEVKDCLRHQHSQDQQQSMLRWQVDS